MLAVNLVVARPLSLLGSWLLLLLALLQLFSSVLYTHRTAHCTVPSPNQTPADSPPLLAFHQKSCSGLLSFSLLTRSFLPLPRPARPLLQYFLLPLHLQTSPSSVFFYFLAGVLVLLRFFIYRLYVYFSPSIERLPFAYKRTIGYSGCRRHTRGKASPSFTTKHTLWRQSNAPRHFVRLTVLQRPRRRCLQHINSSTLHTTLTVSIS